MGGSCPPGPQTQLGVTPTSTARLPALAHCWCDGPISQTWDAEAGGPGPAWARTDPALPSLLGSRARAPVFLGELPAGTAELEAP